MNVSPPKQPNRPTVQPSGREKSILCIIRFIQQEIKIYLYFCLGFGDLARMSSQSNGFSCFANRMFVLWCLSIEGLSSTFFSCLPTQPNQQQPATVQLLFRMADFMEETLLFRNFYYDVIPFVCGSSLPTNRII